MKYIFIFALFIAFISDSYSGEFQFGVFQGKHMLTQGLHDTHEFAGYESNEGYGIITYKNSFEIQSYAIYKSFSAKISENLSLNTKIGFTTGYHKIMQYNGTEYMISMPFVFDGVATIVVPSIDYKHNNHVSSSVSLLGESVNVGITFSF